MAETASRRGSISNIPINLRSEGKMPALVTCRGNKVLEKRWNVGSDDFVLPAFLAMVNGVFVYVTSIVYSLYNYVVLEARPSPGDLCESRLSVAVAA